MRKKVSLDEFEQEIENNLESMQPIPDMEAEITLLKKAARPRFQPKKPTLATGRMWSGSYD